MQQCVVSEERSPYSAGAESEGPPSPTRDQVERALRVAHVPTRVRRSLVVMMCLGPSGRASAAEIANAIERNGVLHEFVSWWRFHLRGWARSEGEQRRALKSLAELPDGLFPRDLELDAMPAERRAKLDRLQRVIAPKLLAAKGSRGGRAFGRVENEFVEMLLFRLGWEVPNLHEVRMRRHARPGQPNYECYLFGKPTLAVEARRPWHPVPDRALADLFAAAEQGGFEWMVTTDGRTLELYHARLRDQPVWALAIEARPEGLKGDEAKRLNLLSREAFEHRRLERVWWDTHSALLRDWTQR